MVVKAMRERALMMMMRLWATEVLEFQVFFDVDMC